MEWFEWAAVIGAVSGLGSMLVTMVSVIVNAIQGRRMERLVESQMRIVASLDRDARRRRKDRGVTQDQTLQRESLELRKREAEWKRTKDIMKGLRWFAENVEP